MPTQSIDIVPDPSLMEDIGAASFTLADAVVELIANSIDARADDQPLEVDVLVSDDEVRVVDNGKGMTREVLAQAVRLGVKMDVFTGSTAKRKGMYGLGMKTAAGNIGRVWSAVTRPIDEDVELSVTFDLGRWKSAAGNPDFQWRIDLVESQPDAFGPLGDRAHGTAVVMKKLRGKNPMAGPVMEKIGHAYRPHLEAGDLIRVNGEQTMAQQYDFYEGSQQEVAIDLGDGKELTGWVALDKKTHNDGLYGLNLYREGQLIEAWNKDFFRGHLMTSRVIGEVHVDFLPVNFNKQGFERTTPEWKQVKVAMTEFLKPVVRASGDMARNKKDTTRFTRAIEGMQNAMGASVKMGDVGDDLTHPVPAQPITDEPTDSIDVEKESLRINGESVSLSFEIADFQSEVTPWSYIYDDESAELQAVVNSNSRLFDYVKKDQSMIGALALADSVAYFLVTMKGMPWDKAIEVRDRWLYLAAGGE